MTPTTDAKASPRVLTVDEAAAIVKCHPDTMRKLMAAGEAPGTKVGREWIVLASVFYQWLHVRCEHRKAGATGVERFPRWSSSRSSHLFDESPVAERLKARRLERARELLADQRRQARSWPATARERLEAARRHAAGDVDVDAGNEDLGA